MKIRVKFKKWGCMKFIGHLDMMRYFQKAVRRADIDIRYSEGYSAHQIMSFAAPLGVGITSDGEYIGDNIIRNLQFFRCNKYKLYILISAHSFNKRMNGSAKL